MNFDCPICYESLPPFARSKDEWVVVVHCNGEKGREHVFHTHCLQRHVTTRLRNQQSLQCPDCRRPFLFFRNVVCSGDGEEVQIIEVSPLLQPAAQMKDPEYLALWVRSIQDRFGIDIGPYVSPDQGLLIPADDAVAFFSYNRYLIQEMVSLGLIPPNTRGLDATKD